MNSENLNSTIADLVNRLPAFPTNADRLLTLAAKPDRNEKEIISLIYNDSSMAVELLHLANNDCMRPDVQVDNIDDAVNIFGLDQLIETIAVSWAATSIRHSFSELANLDAYFAHEQEISKTCAILADISGLDRKKTKMAFAGGLMHDIGRLVIMIAQKKPFAPMLGITPQDMANIIRDEKQAIGMNHCQIGQRICEKWNFSPILCEGVLRHHTPIINDSFSYPGAYIFIAHFVSMSDFTGEMIAKTLPTEILGKLHITPEKFDKAREIYFNNK